MEANSRNILALDVGERRIGVALANTLSRMPSPFTTIKVSEHVVIDIKRLTTENEVSLVVVGLPRNLNGEDTKQTHFVRLFAKKLQTAGINTVWQDEALTSVKAKQELSQRKKPYNKSAVDALAATYILEDYLCDNPGEQT